MIFIYNFYLKITKILPFLWLVIFVAFIFRARYYLGYFPLYDNPDPKLLGFDLHYTIVLHLMFIVFFNFIAFLGLLIVVWLYRVFNYKYCKLWRSEWLVFLGYFIFLIFFVSLFQYVSWLGD